MMGDKETLCHKVWAEPSPAKHNKDTGTGGWHEEI